MQFSRTDLADLAYFLAIARHRSFRRAGLQLGVSGSALSHALKGLEERLGVRLLHRTTRSVNLTAAGEELYEAIGDPISALGQAMERLNRFRDQPVGLVRLNVPPDAAIHLLAPVLPQFAERYPGLEVEVATSNLMIDVVDGGFDAGIRFGGTVPEDMIAQRLSSDIRWMTVAAPSYLEQHGVPEHPDDLMHHKCMRIRNGTGQMYSWELERTGEKAEVAVPGQLIIDETRFAVALAEGGAGICFTAEPAVRDSVARGSLVPVLESWASYGPGYHIYYSGARQVPEGLRLLIAMIREMRPLGY